MRAMQGTRTPTHSYLPHARGRLPYDALRNSTLCESAVVASDVGAGRGGPLWVCLWPTGAHRQQHSMLQCRLTAGRWILLHVNAPRGPMPHLPDVGCFQALGRTPWPTLAVSRCADDGMSADGVTGWVTDAPAAGRRESDETFDLAGRG
jgi:hypothetical protein